MSLMRIRNVKPCFFTHYELFELEQQTGMPVRIAFEGLWCASDREGRFEWKPRALKTVICPYDECDFARILDALADAGFITRYEAEGRVFGHIPRFTVHQSVNPRETASIIPPPPSEKIKSTPEKIQTPENPRVPHALNPRESRVSDAPHRGKGSDEEGCEGKGSDEKEHPLTPVVPGHPEEGGLASPENSPEALAARHHRDYCRRESKGLRDAFLADPAFRDTWCDWIAHLKAKNAGKNPPFTQTDKHKKFLNDLPLADARWAMEEAIRRGLPFPADPAKRPAAERPAPVASADLPALTPEQEAENTRYFIPVDPDPIFLRQFKSGPATPPPDAGTPPAHPEPEAAR